MVVVVVIMCASTVRPIRDLERSLSLPSLDRYWGLDYPPLTAYVSYACGALSAALDPASVDPAHPPLDLTYASATRALDDAAPCVVELRPRVGGGFIERIHDLSAILPDPDLASGDIDAAGAAAALGRPP